VEFVPVLPIDPPEPIFKVLIAFTIELLPIFVTPLAVVIAPYPNDIELEAEVLEELPKAIEELLFKHVLLLPTAIALFPVAVAR
jgi:hypothetical protein